MEYQTIDLHFHVVFPYQYTLSIITNGNISVTLPLLWNIWSQSKNSYRYKYTTN